MHEQVGLEPLKSHQLQMRTCTSAYHLYLPCEYGRDASQETRRFTFQSNLAHL